MSTPLVSVVLTSYNQQPKLKRAFESIINQTYKNLEIIIVDDCSTDGISKGYIEHLTNEYPGVVRSFFQPRNAGIPKNKNTGFKLAKGDFITYLDGDDYYYPGKIMEELNVFHLDETIDVAYSNFNLVSENGIVLNSWKGEKDQVHQGHIFKDVIARNFPKNILFRFELMRAEVLKKIQYYDEGIPAFHDWDSRIRYSTFAKIGFTDFVGSAYVSDTNGISKRTRKIDLLLEMRHVFLKNMPLLEENVSGNDSLSIQKNFLGKNRYQLLKNIDYKRTPLLYLRTKLNFRNL